MSDHWNNLADLIGATPSPESETPKKQPADLQPADAEAASSAAPQDLPAPESEVPQRTKTRATETTTTETGSQESEAPAPSLKAPQPDPIVKPAAETSSPKPKPPAKSHWGKVAGALGLSFGKSDASEEGESPANISPASPAPSEPAADVQAKQEPPIGAQDSDQGIPDVAEQRQPGEAPPSMFGTEKTSFFGFGKKRTSAAEEPPKREPKPAPVRESAAEQKYDKRDAERKLAELFSNPVDTEIGGGLDFSPRPDFEEETPPKRVVDDVSFLDETDDETSSESPDARHGDVDSGSDDEKPKRSRRRRRGGRRRRRKDEDVSSESREAQVDADAHDGPRQSDATAADNDTADRSYGDRSSKQRDSTPRRGRGRGRGRRERQTSDEPTTPSENESGFGAGIEFGAETVDFSEGTREPDEPQPTRNRGGGHEGKGRDESRGSAGEARKARRNLSVTSWKDTVGTIVDANLASRGGSTGGDSRRGGRGGRSRRGGGRSRRGGGGNDRGRNGGSNNN